MTTELRRYDSQDPQLWEPFRELERMQREMRAQLDRWERVLAQGLPFSTDAYTPAADLTETDDAYLVEIELPGVRREDIDIHVEGRRLVVHGERKEKERVGWLRRRTRTVGRFYYEITVPGDIDDQATTASLDSGVLTVRLAKTEAARRRRIPIG